MKKLLAALALISIAVNASEIRVLIKMIPAQEQFFRESLVKGFSAKSSDTVQVLTFQDNWDLTEKAAVADAPPDLIKVPMGMARIMVEKKLVQPLRNLLSEQELKDLSKEYFLMNLATVDGIACYIPRKFETRIMVYRKSKVADAVKGWQSLRAEIDTILKKSFGSGLPEGYALKANPASWDYLDLFTAGYFWSHTDYSGKKAGRIAHRGKDYSGTAIDLMDRCFQLGASQQDLLTINSRYFIDVLKWESLMISSQVYPKEMQEQQWSGTNIWEAFGKENVFLSFLTQIDCYFLHGTDLKDMPGFTKNGADLGFAMMPQGLLPDLHTPGKRGTSTGGWLWAVGAHARDPKQALAFARFITERANQVSECNMFGIIPVRKDILGSANLMFDAPWKNEVFATSLAQLKENGKNALPTVDDFDKIEKQYIAVWNSVASRSLSGYLDETKIRSLIPQ